MTAVALVVWNFTAAETPVYSLFQSPPQSPVATPTPVPPTPVPPTNTPIPPLPTNTPEAAAPAPTQPIQQIQGGAAPDPATPTPVPTQPAAETTATVLQPVEPTATQPPAPAPTISPDSGVVVNQVKLVDTLAQWLAYGLICVGAFLLVFLAAFFLYMNQRGKKLNRES